MTWYEIISKEDFIHFYEWVSHNHTYCEKLQEGDFPEQYPCLTTVEHVDGGDHRDRYNFDHVYKKKDSDEWNFDIRYDWGKKGTYPEFHYVW